MPYSVAIADPSILRASGSIIADSLKIKATHCCAAAFSRRKAGRPLTLLLLR